MEKENINLISLEKVLEVCSNFIKSPNDIAVNKNYLDLEKELIIKSYIPMNEKILCLYKIMLNADRDMNVTEAIFTAALEMSILFDGLLIYTNIDNNTIIRELQTYENYDILYQSGFVDNILQFCQKDFDRLLKMIDRTISYSNLFDLINTISQVDTEHIPELLEKIDSISGSWSPEMLKDASDILRFNDPLIAKVKDDFEEYVLNQSEKNIKNKMGS